MIIEGSIGDDGYDKFELFAKNLQKKYTKHLAFSITNQCPLKCDHCIVNAGSLIKESEEMSFEKFKEVVLQISDLKGMIELISMTGGEPFVKPEKIKFLSDYACKNDIKVGVMTSAFWAKTPEIALTTIDNFPNISFYGFSTDVYHTKYVPLQYIKNAYFAAKKRNKKTLIKISQRYNPSEKEECIIKHLRSFVENNDEIIINNLVPLGRANESIQDAEYPYTSEVPCIQCLTSSPVIREDGVVEPCCGALVGLKEHPLILGNVHNDSLKQIYYNNRHNALLHYIRLWGLKDLISLIETSELKDKLPKTYIKGDVCTACWYLFSNIYISKFLYSISKTLAFRFKVAAGMSYYLDDDEMLKEIKVQLKHSDC